jgi:GNAT superfamily N-acetyltransferase
MRDELTAGREGARLGHMPSLIIITSPRSPLLEAWQALYESAFPAEERVPFEHLTAFLTENVLDGESPPGVGAHTHMLAALDEEDRFAGLAHYTLPPEAGGRAAYLGYIATLPELRGQGLGAWLYRGILARLPRSVDAMLFDLEIPERMPDPAERALARRRIRFYQRLGARLLDGIRYTNQAGPRGPLLTLHLMVHPLADLPASEAVELAKTWLPDCIEQTGDIQYRDRPI